MKPVKLGIRIWIAITSVVSFLAGWALFSHAGKPAPLPFISSGSSNSASQAATSSSGAVQLQPIPSLDSLVQNSASSSGSSSNVNPLPSFNNNFSQSLPAFRTRGS
jgi:hypothetical protein